ncbi:rhomboid family intramembrane serine protease [Streptomyces sp. SP17BM10]|uniref:rhomboid family intramembrane serine protease n=1 Tax=Streptomyces sp. SP17BM10 TaxID=3002530 RepID=UPI002E77FB34|nr:rhomboid family intramembrane serine protease [Streptomyces sp. SP17BM10]MEE1787798.1 rhomboid family intramembrane serine protease [Streptomyces sp. SP17BM10]
MSPHAIGLYASAAVVVGVGLRTLVLVGGAAGDGGGPGEVAAVVRAAWARRPWVTSALFVVMAVMAVVQSVAPSVIGELERRPGALTDGQWWRAGTALLVQSSGWAQIAMNLSALLVIGAVAESVLGRGWTLAVFLGSGVAAHVVSLAGWSPDGGGDSVAICGLLGALAVGCLLRGRWQASWFVLLVPACGLFLCLMRNNHGAGLTAGCLLGLVCAPRPWGRAARQVAA